MPAIQTVAMLTLKIETTDKAKEEQRPRSRRSPRHMRAHGQRRRQNADASDIKSEITEDPVTARYPEQSATASNDSASEITESTPTVAEVQKVQADALTEVINNPDNEVQQNLAFDEPEVTDVKTEVEATEKAAIVAETVKVETTEAAEAATDGIVQVANVNVDNSASSEDVIDTEDDKAEAPTVTEAKVEEPMVIEQPAVIPDVVTSTDDNTANAPVATVDTKSEVADEKPKKVRAKVKNIKRKVKAAASKTSGKASAPMTKPETIVSHGNIPREFVASEQRALHAKSGRTALVSDATSRHSAGPTKPTLD